MKTESSTPRTDKIAEEIRDIEDSIQAIEMLTRHARELEEELGRAIDAAFTHDPHFFSFPEL